MVQLLGVFLGKTGKPMFIRKGVSLLLANNFAPHELLELHELLSSETTAVQKLQACVGTVKDNQLKTSKFCITGLLRAATEATNTQFRQFVNQSLEDVVQEHFLLADTIISKGWYQPSDINAQLQDDLTIATQITPAISATNQSNTCLQ